MVKILVVDSDAGVRSLLVEFLVSLSGSFDELISLSTAEDAQRSIEKASPSFDLVITGNWLGHQNGGAELTRWIKEHFPKMSVILMSGSGEPDHHRADVFFSKPFDIRDMQDAVSRLLAA